MAANYNIPKYSSLGSFYLDQCGQTCRQVRTCRVLFDGLYTASGTEFMVSTAGILQQDRQAMLQWGTQILLQQDILIYNFFLDFKLALLLTDLSVLFHF